MLFRLRTLLIAFAAIAIVVALGSRFYEKQLGPTLVSQAIHDDLYTLVDRRPSGMTAKQWETAVAWTLNLHANSLLPFQAPLDDIVEFRSELRDRLNGRVDMSTIDWIWDRYSDLCSGGQKYQHYRPQMNDEILNGGVNWGLTIR